MTLFELLVSKLTSGRFIFTVVAASVFAYLSITQQLGTDKVMEVVLIVIYAYFNRADRKTNGENDSDTQQPGGKQ